ncbi:hypothetical protein Tco_0110940 [Tanacetum coccineum]
MAAKRTLYEDDDDVGLVDMVMVASAAVGCDVKMVAAVEMVWVIGGEDDDVMVVLIVVVRVAGAWRDGVAGNPPERRQILKRRRDVWLGFVKNMVTLII